LRITVREKIRPKDYETEIQKLNDEPKSIYPKILDLPSREPQKRSRAKFDPLTKSFDSYMEATQ